MSNEKLKLVYVYPVKASFVQLDLEYLPRYFDVKAVYFSIRNKWAVPFEILKLIAFLSRANYDAVLINFGGFHAWASVLVARIRRKNSYIILNGIDAAAIPEWEYGYLRGGLIRKACLWSYNRCTKLLPVSRSLIQSENSFAFDPPKTVGLQTMSSMDFQYQVMPNGFDITFWKAEGNRNRNQFVTVIGSQKRAAFKGLDLIIDWARKHPDFQFVIAGISEYPDTPHNMRFLGFLDLDQLKKVYSASTYYLQLSSWEGFGCALCEAMLCGCIPIVSSVNALPMIIGNTGLVVPKKSVEALEQVWESADFPSLNKPRTQIVDQFPINHRMQLLKETIE